jgi:hypothetical protein
LKKIKKRKINYKSRLYFYLLIIIFQNISQVYSFVKPKKLMNININKCIKNYIENIIKKIKMDIPIMNHTNFKIFVFLYLILYSYFKLKKINYKNYKIFKITDVFHFIFLFVFKNYYNKEERSNLYNINSFIFLIFINQICGGLNFNKY